MKNLTYILIVCSIISIHGSLLPDGLTFCKKSDPNFQKCLAKAMTAGLKKFGNGVKELGFYSLNPLKLEKIEIGESGSSSITLNQKYTDIELYNLVDGIVEETNIDFDKGTWSIKAVGPKSSMKANYVLKGQILVFPINAHGKCEFTLLNSRDEHNAKFEIIEKGGKKYLHCTDYQLKLNPENVTYYFENIMPGNEQLSNELLKTINENSLNVFKDISSGFEKIYSVIFKDLVNKVFGRVPMDEIFLD